MARGKVRDKSKEAFWRRTMRRQRRSGLTVRAFCREHALRETALYFWRRELAKRAKREAARRRSTTFLPVRVTAAPAQRVTAEVRPAPRREPQPPSGRIEIVLSGDRRVRVAAPVDRQALADVLAVLRFDALAAPSNADGSPDREAAAC